MKPLLPFACQYIKSKMVIKVSLEFSGLDPVKSAEAVSWSLQRVKTGPMVPAVTGSATRGPVTDDAPVVNPYKDIVGLIREYDREDRRRGAGSGKQGGGSMEGEAGRGKQAVGRREWGERRGKEGVRSREGKQCL